MISLLLLFAVRLVFLRGLFRIVRRHLDLPVRRSKVGLVACVLLGILALPIAIVAVAAGTFR